MDGACCAYVGGERRVKGLLLHMVGLHTSAFQDNWPTILTHQSVPCYILQGLYVINTIKPYINNFKLKRWF
jgi:hypothetical protein